MPRTPEAPVLDASFCHLHGVAVAAERLASGGIATWNIEYRRVGHDGGGWPGTFLDLGAALDHLGVLGRDYRLALKRIVALGHSSGGHFAAWLAIRDQLPASSDIRGDPKIRLAGAVLAVAGELPLAQQVAAQARGVINNQLQSADIAVDVTIFDRAGKLIGHARP